MLKIDQQHLATQCYDKNKDQGYGMLLLFLGHRDPLPRSKHKIRLCSKNNTYDQASQKWQANG